MIRGNRRLTVRETADEVGISIGSCHEIFTEKLQMRRVSVKFVPRLLTDDQKENRVEISKELLANANGNENFLKNTITGDETWVYVYDVETKMQSSMWMVILEQKSTDESVKDQGDVSCIFSLERNCPS